MGTEERIREAATALFYEMGYRAASTRDIAAAVGIKAGSLYNHFPSKENLLFTIVFQTTKDFLDSARAALEGIEGPEERLRALIEAHVEFHARRRQEAWVADNELRALDDATRVKVVAIRDQHEQLLKSILREGESALGWRIPDLSLVAIAIETLCTDVATWYREGGRFSPAKIGRIYGDFVLAALEA